MSTGRKKKLTGASVAAVLAAAAVISVIHARAGAADVQPQLVTQTEDGYKAEMELGSSPVKILHHNAFTVTLTDENGMPVKNSKLKVVLSMPSMICGDASFEMREVAPGVYKGDAVPLMAGVWEAVVSAETESGTITFTRKLKAER
jgi:nitrogen fixation protein FixH